jgi:bifunctional DNA primase/polymerase-like protein/primase-like protein
MKMARLIEATGRGKHLLARRCMAGFYGEECEPKPLKPSVEIACAGWELYPVYAVDATGLCTCRRRERCKDPGKHPATKHGFNDAISDPLKIAAMFGTRPGCNIGVATRVRSRVAVLDVDSYYGGGQSLKRLQEEHGPLPGTRVHQSGGADVHYFYALPEGLEHLPSKDLADGIELKADGSGVVLPPSKHLSGGRYEVLIGGPLAPLPQWIIEAANRLDVIEGGHEGVRPTDSRFELPELIFEGIRNRILYRYGCSLRAHGWEHGAILQELRKVNAERCVPPLDDDEVRRISQSAASHAKGNASKVSPEVLEAVAFLEEKARVRTAKGLGGRSRWACYRALLDCSKRHGSIYADRDVAVRISVRQVALDAGLSLRTTYRSLDALLASGLVYRASYGEGATPGALALRMPARQARSDTNRGGGGGWCEWCHYVPFGGAV